ncbi:MAG: response regulator, partial [Nocardioidaceae bacterium]
MTNVVLVDDEALVRSGLRAVLSSEPDIDVVGEAEDGAEVPGMVSRLRPDLVLMDVRMPRIDGIEATRRLVARDDPPKVLVVTTFENDEYVYEALLAGASGFLLKRARP